MSDKTKCNALDTYKSRRWVTLPKFDFAEEDFTRLLADVKPDWLKMEEKMRKLGLFGDDDLQSRLMMVSPRVERIKNYESMAHFPLTQLFKFIEKELL